MNVTGNLRKWAMGTIAALSFLVAVGVTQGTAQNAETQHPFHHG